MGVKARAVLLAAGVATPASAQLRMVSNDDEFIVYSGKITLSGTLYTDTGNLGINDRVCFVPDAGSRKKIAKTGKHGALDAPG